MKSCAFKFSGADFGDVVGQFRPHRIVVAAVHLDKDDEFFDLVDTGRFIQADELASQHGPCVHPPTVQGTNARGRRLNF